MEEVEFIALRHDTDETRDSAEVTVAEVFDSHLPFQWIAYFLCCCCWIWGACTNVALPWMLLDMNDRLALSSSPLGLIAAAQTAGQVGGYLVFGFLGDKHGRRKCILMSNSNWHAKDRLPQANFLLEMST